MYYRLLLEKIPNPFSNALLQRSSLPLLRYLVDLVGKDTLQIPCIFSIFLKESLTVSKSHFDRQFSSIGPEK